MQHKQYKKVVLIVLDGFGVAPESHGNAIAQARIPTFNFLVNNFPHLSLQASGPLVGLPWGEMGNSEVGHLNIGAGRIVGQDLPKISASIQSGKFFTNPVLLEAVEHVKSNNSSLHLVGLVSNGGVHSLDEHMYALLGLAAAHNIQRVFIHMFTDGRDTEPKVALESIRKLNDHIQTLGVGRVATITGRFYAMDRGGHFGQTVMTYKALVEGAGQTANSPEECIEKNYESQIFDEMIPPTVILDGQGQPVAKISENDAVIFSNFRSDRALQLTQAFVQPTDFPEQFRQPTINNLYFATMTEYYMYLPTHVIFPPVKLKNNLAEILSKTNFTQFHIAESEKYAHVTAFFNCGWTEKFFGEERVIITSPENSRNYSDHPEMSAMELTKSLVKGITSAPTNFFLANYANADMVGHTGNLNAGIKAVEALDACLRVVVDATLAQDAALLITADHGNIEQMINLKSGGIDKDHTTNPVPFFLVANEFRLETALQRGFLSLSAEVPAGVICDIAPTILDLFGLPKPEEMTGINLLDVMDQQKKSK